MVAVWSEHYFADEKVWTLAEAFARQQRDVLARERPLIPMLIGDCDVPPLFRNIIHLDFRNPADHDLRFRQLIQALDLPRRDFAPELEAEPFEHDLPPAERGRRAHFHHPGVVAVGAEPARLAGAALGL